MTDLINRAQAQWRLLRAGEVAPEAFRAFLAEHGLTPQDISLTPEEVDREEVWYNKYVRV